MNKKVTGRKLMVTYRICPFWQVGVGQVYSSSRKAGTEGEKGYRAVFLGHRLYRQAMKKKA